MQDGISLPFGCQSRLPTARVHQNALIHGRANAWIMANAATKTVRKPSRLRSAHPAKLAFGSNQRNLVPCQLVNLARQAKGDHMPKESSIAKVVAGDMDRILADWLEALKEGITTRGGRITELQLQTQARDFLRQLGQAMATGLDAGTASYAPIREMLGDISRSRAVQGFTPTETASFVFSLKEVLFASLNRSSKDAEVLARGTWEMTKLLDFRAALMLHADALALLPTQALQADLGPID